MFKFALMLLALVSAMFSLCGQTPADTNASITAAPAINALGVDLFRATSAAGENALLSPYSIETALAMAYLGADGQTRDEMARVLHLSGNQTQVATAFAALQAQLDNLVTNSARAGDELQKYGPTRERIQLSIANRLFGEQHYEFKPAFLDLLELQLKAPLEPMDFRHNASGATRTINNWVAQQTRNRIQNIVPAGALSETTRLVLVNALYLKAPWRDLFHEEATKPLPFHVRGGEAVNVPTMNIQRSFGYTNADGFSVVSVPYQGNELQFLIILPDDTNGLVATETRLTADKLTGWANLPVRDVNLFLPKFKMEPPSLALGQALQKLGMTTAFDIPRGSANFDFIAPRHPDDYLAISDVLHKTFISVDEKGTEAAAATAVVMFGASALRRQPEIVQVKVDHPFVFAIQHRASGACLFLGHVTDPR